MHKKNETDFYKDPPSVLDSFSKKTIIFVPNFFLFKRQCYQLWLFDYQIGNVFTIKIPIQNMTSQ